MKKLLLLGYNSSIAKAFIEKYKSEYVIHGFGRGQHSLKIDRVITGSWDTLGENIFIDNDYDAIINFIFLREETVKMNISYTQEIVQLYLKQKKSCELIHISSTMVHGTDRKIVSKSFPPLPEYDLFGYALVKARTEEYLDRNIQNIHILRFGYISNTHDFLYSKVGKNIVVFKGTKMRVIPMTYWTTVLNSIVSCINRPSKRSFTIVVDEYCNINTAKKYSNIFTLYIPRYILYIGLFCSYILRLERLRVRLKVLNMQVTYEQ